jgi:hypothetical protein
MEESQAMDLELKAKWEKVKSIINGRDMSIDIGYDSSLISAGGNVIGTFGWPKATIDFIINNEEFLKMASPKTCLDVIDEEQDLPPEANENGITRLAFLAGWRYGKYYRDLGDKEYCFKKFLELLNKKINKIKKEED